MGRSPKQMQSAKKLNYIYPVCVTKQFLSSIFWGHVQVTVFHTTINVWLQLIVAFRTIVMEYVQDQYVDGILGYYFQLRNDTFLSSSESMENECFCDNKTVDMDGSYSCLGSGFINLQNCKGKCPNILFFKHYDNGKKSSENFQFGDNF